MIDKILVPFDGSKTGENGLKYACWLANKVGAKITVLYVLNIPYTGESAVTDMDSLIAAGERVLDIAKRILKEENCPSVNFELRQGIGNPAHEIVKMSKEGAFSLIVMSATGHTALSHLLMGSVSDTVVHQAPCSVYIVR